VRAETAVADPDYAVVQILCSHAQLLELQEIANLEVMVRPLYTEDPDVIEVAALADEDAQQAVLALGCQLTVEQSATDYAAQVDAAYEGLSDDPGPVA
jgi:uncharacterized lipoprotein YmbA